MLRSPFRLRTADLEDEIPQNLSALRRMVHLGMKLDRVPLFGNVLYPGDRVMCLGHQLEAGREFQRLIAM